MGPAHHHAIVRRIGPRDVPRGRASRVGNIESFAFFKKEPISEMQEDFLIRSARWSEACLSPSLANTDRLDSIIINAKKFKFQIATEKMSRDMVGANCGTDNPMMQMVNHFTQDKARAAELGQLGGRPQPGMVRQHSPRFPSPHVSSASSIGCRSFHGCCCSGGMDAAYTLRRCYPAGSARPDLFVTGRTL